MPHVDIWTCTLPWPPSTNGYYRHVVIGRSARVLISREGRSYRSRVAGIVGPLPPSMAGRLAVEIDAYPPDRRARDLDNVCKALLDAIQHAGLILDDSQIDDLHIRRHATEPGGRLHITIETLEEAA